MVCSNCGRENRPGAVFCDQCGERLQNVCQACGAVNRAEARFCDVCGTALKQSAPSTAAAPSPTVPPATIAGPASSNVREVHNARDGERRTVTALFIDAVDSTATGERVDPEALHASVRDCTQKMVEAVHKYEGTVTQFRGDGIMALFGAPVAYEDSARRAVAAALAMRDTLVAFAEELTAAGRPFFHYRIGLNTGPVIVGRIGDDLSLDYTAIGDTVNLAARMEQSARPDSVFVSVNTFRQARQYFEFVPLGALEIKGKAEPVVAYEVVRELPEHERSLVAAADGQTPFVGRDRELASLNAYFDHAARGEGQVVFISGEAGMGKSRLLQEFRLSVTGQEPAWLEGHCSIYGGTTPYLPITGLVRSAFGVEEGQAADEVQARIESVSESWSTGARAALPYLRLLLNIDPRDATVLTMDAAQRRAGIIDAVRTLVLQLAARAPVVVLVEDLHWIDQQSQETLAALIDSVASAPVLLLLAFRPGYVPPFGDRSYMSRLSLGSIAPEDALAISRAVLEGADLPEAIAGLVTRKAEGNPFYVEEVTRTLVESGALKWQDGGLVLLGSSESIEIPDTIQGVILGRIDRLGSDARATAQLAAVIGRDFPVRLLDRMSDLSVPVATPLSELKTAELVHEKAFFPEVAFAFKHALVHDVAYSTLLLERRRLLHRRVAMAIEELYEDRLAEQFEMLARHFFEGQDWPKAIHYSMMAGRKAIDAFANDEAVSFFDRALEAIEALNPQSAERVRLVAEALAYRGRALAQATRWAAGRADLEKALPDLAEGAELHLQVLADLALTCWWARDTRAMERYAEELSRLARASGRNDFLLLATGWLVSAAGADGDPLSSIQGIAPVMAEAEKLGVSLPPGPGAFLPLWNYWTGRLDQAVSAGLETVTKARRDNQVAVLMEALPHYGISLAARGRYREAQAAFDEARAVGGRFNLASPTARSIAMEAGYHLDLFDFARAEEIQREARERAAALNFPPALVSAGIDLLLNFARRGEPELAEAIEDEVAAAVARESGWHGWQWNLRLAEAEAELALARGQWEQAIDHAGRAIEMSLRPGRVKYQVAALMTRGRALMALHRDGWPDLEKAVDLARGVGDPALFVRAALASLAFRDDAALLSEARDAFHRIDAELPDAEMRQRIGAVPALQPLRD